LSQIDENEFKNIPVATITPEKERCGGSRIPILNLSPFVNTSPANAIVVRQQNKLLEFQQYFAIYKEKLLPRCSSFRAELSLLRLFKKRKSIRNRTAKQSILNLSDLLKNDYAPLVLILSIIVPELFVNRDFLTHQMQDLASIGKN